MVSAEAYAMAGPAIGIGAYQTWQHSKNWIVPEMQSLYLFICWTPAVFALAGCHMWLQPDEQHFIEVGTALYEALDLIAFFELCIGFGGGDGLLAQKMGERGVDTSPVTFCHCPLSSHRAKIDLWRRCIYQVP